MRNFMAWIAGLFLIGAPAMDQGQINREAAVEAAHVLAYSALYRPSSPIPKASPEPPVAPAEMPDLGQSEQAGPLGWTTEKLLSIVVSGLDMWMERRGYGDEMDRCVHNAKRLNDALDAFAANKQAFMVAADHPNRSRVKILISGYTSCKHCHKLFADLVKNLTVPSLNWRVQSIESIVDIDKASADFVYIEYPDEEAIDGKYPKISVLVDGKAVKVHEGPVSTRTLANWWMEEFRKL